MSSKHKLKGKGLKQSQGWRAVEEDSVWAVGWTVTVRWVPGVQRCFSRAKSIAGQGLGNGTGFAPPRDYKWNPGG